MDKRAKDTARLPGNTAFKQRAQNKRETGSRLELAGHISLVFIGIAAVILALQSMRIILAPIALGLLLGTLLLPFSNRLERAGLSSAGAAVVSLLLLITGIVSLFIALSVPASVWMDRIPAILYRVSQSFSDWKAALSGATALGEFLSELALDEDALKEEITEAKPIAIAVVSVPAFLMQLLIFFATAYFFLLTRKDIRAKTLRACFRNRTRLRLARAFREIERSLVTYLGQITLINIGLGLATTIAMWLLGLPTPYLWGVLAAVLNYIMYVGPAIMTGILLMVGLTLSGQPVDIFLPAIAYLVINLIEANFVTPYFLGRNLIGNPFLVFLSLVLWIWLWGPAGGFIAVPVLLMIQSVVYHKVLHAQSPSRGLRQPPSKELQTSQMAAVN